MKKGILIFFSTIIICCGTAAIIYFYLFTETTIYFPTSDSVTCDISGSRRHVSFTPTLVIKERGKDKFLTKNLVKINDIILFTVREYTEEELLRNNINEQLSREIIFKLSTEFKIDYIDEIIFSGFVIV